MATGLNTASELVKQATRQETDDGVVLYARLEGEINLHNSPAVRADLLKLVEEEHPRTVLLNLAEVPYMDSSAIAVLVEVLKNVRVDGGRVVLCELQKRVAGLLHIARLDTIFVIVENDEAARAEAGLGAPEAGA